jgi:hypothetical protein
MDSGATQEAIFANFEGVKMPGLRKPAISARYIEGG